MVSEPAHIVMSVPVNKPYLFRRSYRKVVKKL